MLTLREWAAFGLKVVSKKYKVMQSFPKKKDPSFAELLNSKGEVQQTFREDGEPEKGILPAFNAFSKVRTPYIISWIHFRPASQKVSILTLSECCWW